MPRNSVAEVIRRHSDRLVSLPGVVGMAEGECGGRPCILVLVARKSLPVERAIPRHLEGIPVEIRETGPIQARDSG